MKSECKIEWIKLLLVFFGTFFSSVLIAQLKGKVIDAETFIPVPDARILTGDVLTFSNTNGEFVLNNNKGIFLIVSHLGYLTDTAWVDEIKGELNIFLVPDYTHLEQITVKGPLMPGNVLYIPASVSLMQSEDLTRSTGISWIEKLNGLPGVFVHNGTINTNRVTVRGIGSRTPYGTNRIKAYFNEIPLTSGDGTTSMEDIDPLMINTVEVIRGSKCAVYGQGMGGVILLSGKKYFENGLHGNIGFEAGSFGTMNPKISLYYKRKKISSSVAYSFAKSDGWRQNSDYYRHSLNSYTNLNFKNNKTGMLFHLIDMKAFIPSSLNEEDYSNSPESAASNWLNVRGFEEYRRILTGINNELRLNDKFSNATVIYFNYYNGYESRPFNILDDNALQGGAKSSLNFATATLRLKFGAEFMFEKYNWKIYETQNGVQGDLLNSYVETRNPFRYFFHGAYTLKKGGIVEAGISYNYLNYRIEDLFYDSLNRSGDFKYSPVLSPFLGINLPFGESLKIYASIGHGFSYPTVEETLLPDGQANPDLKPENGFNLELGARLTAFNGMLFTDAAFYLLYVNDLLVTERFSEDIFTGKNAGKTKHWGFEFQTVLLLNQKQTYYLPETKLSISLTVSENKFTHFIEDGIDYSNKHLPGIPESSLFAGLYTRYKSGLYAYIQYNYTGKQFLNDQNNDVYGSYSLINLKLGYQLSKLYKLKPEIYLGIQNLFNQHYASMILVNASSFGNLAPRYYYPGQERSFYFGILLTTDLSIEK